MHRSLLIFHFVAAGLVLATSGAGLAFTQSPVETTRPEHKRTDSQQATPPQQKQPTAAELSAKETPATALLRTFEYEELEFRSAAEGIPVEKYNYRPTQGDYGGVFPGYGPKELRTFGEQVKHVACANFGFSAEMDGKTPPPDCDKGGPNPAKTRDELVVYLRDSFKALKKSIGAITVKNMFDPIAGQYGGPDTRLGMAITGVWHVADHYGQIVVYMRLNGIVPPASRPNPPELQD